jgi:branched-chain amino acid transport system permease protein
MQSVGYNVYLIRVQAYGLSAFIISVAGALYVLNHQFVSLEAVQWQASGDPVMMTLLGGVGTLYGPMLGAGMVLLLRNSLSTVTDSGSLVLGCLFVVVVMVFRRGVLGEIAHHLVHRGRQGPLMGSAARADLPVALSHPDTTGAGRPSE